MYFEWLRALQTVKGGALIVTPLMVVKQTIEEAAKFYHPAETDGRD
jgi:hypothetical protein